MGTGGNRWFRFLRAVGGIFRVIPTVFSLVLNFFMNLYKELYKDAKKRGQAIPFAVMLTCYVGAMVFGVFLVICVLIVACWGGNANVTFGMGLLGSAVFLFIVIGTLMLAFAPEPRTAKKLSKTREKLARARKRLVDFEARHVCESRLKDVANAVGSTPNDYETKWREIVEDFRT